MFTFDDPAAFPWGGEPILMDGRNVGELTSAGYSRQHGRAWRWATRAPTRALTDDVVLGARYQVDIAGELFAVTPHVKLGVATTESYAAGSRIAEARRSVKLPPCCRQNDRFSAGESCFTSIRPWTPPTSG